MVPQIDKEIVVKFLNLGRRDIANFKRARHGRIDCISNVAKAGSPHKSSENSGFFFAQFKGINGRGCDGSWGFNGDFHNYNLCGFC